MRPELFQIPFLDIPVYGYGTMLMLGLVTAVLVIRRLSRDIAPTKDSVVNVACVALLVGLVGARMFFVIHHWDKIDGGWIELFAIWKGGLEMLGGVIPAVLFILWYLWKHKLPTRRFLDIIAIGLFAALAFGRIGCFLNGCCYGRPTDCRVAIRFPYGSLAYQSQIRPDLARGRGKPHLEIPDEYFYTVDGHSYLRPEPSLTESQRHAVTHGAYRSLPVHPTQLYASALAAMLAGAMFALWRWGRKVEQRGGEQKWYQPRQGYVFAAMCVTYGIMRFSLESVRDDNPLEFTGLTVSQNLSVLLIIAGIVALAVCSRMRPWLPAASRNPQPTKAK